MVRQCAWCLRLINGVGELLSATPLPKLYEASHGICTTCGTSWMEEVVIAQEIIGQDSVNSSYSPGDYQSMPTPSVAELVLELQQAAVKAGAPKLPRLKKGSLRLL